jgi:hypothetical protein
LKQTTTSVLQFKGKLTFEKIGILLNDLKNRKKTFDIQSGLYKKLLTLMIEVLENVLKYSDHFEEFSDKYPEYLPEFELTMDDECFILLSRNPVRERDKEVLSRKIERINASTEDELKKIYRETITNGMFTEKGGAGLGLIEMAKITNQDLVFTFSPTTTEYSIYELVLRINHIDQFNHA